MIDRPLVLELEDLAAVEALPHVDADGYVYLAGRAKDRIIRGGHNIGPVPVEEALLTHPGVTAAAAVGRPDAHAVPKAVYVVESLPLTAVGKIFKPRLREDAVRRVVLALLDRAGIAGTVETSTRDGVPHAEITVTGDVGALVAELRRHTFTHTVRGAHE
ncbi:hypothetical protein [Nonomuraea sp. B19D2]|uniref:hypothetical protein n=1 Tax=Nonomuraea sp. B19D2 TaxID=3159561 RepID=UPI0032DA42D6